MAVRLPTLDQIVDLGADFGVVLIADEIAACQQAFKGPLASYGRLDEFWCRQPWRQLRRAAFEGAGDWKKM